MLWSPVGAPAGVPGPRRNADECDAGWFAPVATRRRPICGALRAPSLRFAVFPGGTTPGTPGWDAYPRCPSATALVRGSPSRPCARLGLMVCPDTSVGRLSVRSSSVVRGWRHLQPAGNSHACPPTSGPETRPPRCRRVRRQPSRELPAAVRSAGHWTHTGPSPVLAGSPRWAGGGLPGRGVLSAAR